MSSAKLSGLRVNTSMATAGPGPSSASYRSKKPSPLNPNPTYEPRGRTPSTASNASSTSLISPGYSSSGSSSRSGSATRLHSRSPSPAPKGSLDLEETMGPLTDYVLAMHDWAPQQENATCLSFKAGQVIHVLNRDTSGWWDGELEGRRGWFPSNFVNTQPEDEDEGDVTQVIPQQHHTPKPWAGDPTTPRRLPPRATTTDSDADVYCPPIMVPLLQALSLLQSAVRSNRAHHFQPSTACIISCVRSILTSTNTLQRDAPMLHQHPQLAHERRAILAVLANLVAQAKRASENDGVDIDSLEIEVDAMLRLGGQVFSQMRRFLAVAVQCGLKLPEKGALDEVIDTSTWPSDPYERRAPSPQPEIRSGVPLRQHLALYDTVPMSPIRTKSMSEMAGGTAQTAVPQQMAQSRSAGWNEPNGYPHALLRGHRHNISSVSSSTSSSSLSSLEPMPPRPTLPDGPCSASQIAESMRATHDHYLSTIAALIGHVHTYSRTSHASSTGHMYELVREVVEVVCKLLTIVEAVLTNPDVPEVRLETLRTHKDSLYHVTSSLAESVRMLTNPLPAHLTEEEERQALLKYATEALRLGSECVQAVRVALGVAPNARLYVLPTIDVEAHIQQALESRDEEDTFRYSGPVEDDTVHAQAQHAAEVTIHIERGSDSGHSAAKSTSSMGSQATTHMPKNLSPLLIGHGPVEPDLPSPSSFARTEDGTTWEGSIRSKSVEEKMIHGELPFIPGTDIIDPRSWYTAHEYGPDDVAYNKDGHLVGATLGVLVERMTPHDTVVDSAFSAVFFLTFRIFCSPRELVNALMTRWHIPRPAALPIELHDEWYGTKVLPIRMRVSNFVKTWVETYWQSDVDDPVMGELVRFVEEDIGSVFTNPAGRILELFDIRAASKDYTISPRGDRSRDPGMSINPPATVASEIPRPVLSKAVYAALRAKSFATIAITDFDPLELARQLTIMECNLYCAIQPEEIMECGQDGVKPPLNVKAVTSLSTVITGWVMESILNEPDIKKRMNLIKFFIKVADRCSTLNNYSTPRSMLAALDSSTISRLRQTWATLPQKNRLQLEAMRRVADHGRNYHEYRSKLRNTAPPAVPFLGLYLTDVTFCREGNPSHRISPLNPDKKLLNFNKYHKLARIVQDMQRFQVPYTLKAIPEVQMYLNFIFQNAQQHGDLQDLYRRSLLVEPKQPADQPPTSDMRNLFSWATRSQIPKAPMPQPTAAS
ncbi:ras GEF [Cylindrobasidium torrendii FP15055 ss-10]|uniref:Ras GEF n=1 Tax=Cylindrobasidium torrendii FP15055 ss-10 TaxID=1314674 RepID=A0A0D7ATX5_9AGAR|nr:ras GEF [Cylindrobasidium torrendii FP15055 ss-10]